MTSQTSTNGITNSNDDAPKSSGAIRKTNRDTDIGSSRNCARFNGVCCWRSSGSGRQTTCGRDFRICDRAHGISDYRNNSHGIETSVAHNNSIKDEATSVSDNEMNSVIASALAEFSDGPPRDISIHGSHLPALGSSQHDCGSLARVVMVRKTDQRVINRKDNPQCKVVTLETIQTYRGHKPDRTFVSQQIQENPTNVPKICTTGVQNELNSLSLNETSSTPKRNTPKMKTPSPVLRKSGYSVFEVECLEAHNEYRRAHGVVSLKLNKKLCQFAEEWAKIIALRGNPVHRSNSPYGENIFCAWSSSSDLVINGREPVENWYSEITSHIFGKEPTTLKTGHFTQVVWADSRELGVAQAKNRSGHVFVVANYDPPGNFIGSFTINVPPIISSTSTSGSSTKSSSRLSNSFKSDRSLSSRSPSTPNLDDFPKQVLKHHNELRRKHGAPELHLSDDLNFCAQEWAETLAKEDRFAHRPNCRYGENLYCLWSSDRNANPNARDVCRTWYDENKEYTYGTEPSRVLNSGHFTQLVWKSSLELGVGVAKTKQGKVLVVCNYHPRGNIIGQFSKNVSKTGH